VQAEKRTIEVIKVDQDGMEEKESLLSDTTENLAELLKKLAQGSYRNGRYRVYLKEVSLPENKVTEWRLLMEVYKSGQTLGDPVHEPGPGANPIQQGKPEPKASAALRGDGVRPVGGRAMKAAVAPAQASPAGAAGLRAANGGAREATFAPASGERTPAAHGSQSAGKDGRSFRLSYAGLRYPAVGAALAAIGSIHAHGPGDWTRRVDQAMEDSRSGAFGRVARLRRCCRKKT
jgi:hypothetical protein